MESEGGCIQQAVEQGLPFCIDADSAARCTVAAAFKAWGLQAWFCYAWSMVAPQQGYRGATCGQLMCFSGGVSAVISCALCDVTGHCCYGSSDGRREGQGQAAACVVGSKPASVQSGWEVMLPV